MFKPENSDNILLDRFCPQFWTKLYIFHFLQSCKQVFIFMFLLAKALDLQIFCSSRSLEFLDFYWKKIHNHIKIFRHSNVFDNKKF